MPIGGWELALVVLVIMVLFGYKKLPDATRSLGRSMRIFKAETRGLRDDSDTGTDTRTDTTTAGGPPTVTAQPIAPPPPSPTDGEQVQHRQP
jgi:sec-independent protein translocase protein TatA